MLELNQITFGYNRDHHVLHDVSLSIQAGEFIAVVGRNGSGKTTVTRLMMALKKPVAGSVRLDGGDMAKATPADMARHIGYVFQNPDRQMFRDTVEREISFGPEQLGFAPTDLRQAVDRALNLTGIAHLAEAYPMTLSKGQKQRVAIASALAMSPRLLILDEPTSGQDARERQRLMELLTDLNKQGVAIVLVTHDMELVARYARRVIVMAQGAVAFDGTPQELFNGGQPLGEWGLQTAKSTISREIENLAPQDKTRTAAASQIAPLTKLLFTLAVSLWSLVLDTAAGTAGLVTVLILLLAAAEKLRPLARAIGVLAVFAALLAGVQYAFGGGWEFSLVTGLRMMAMAIVFLLLLATTSMQHLTAALVNQCRVPREYAFMFTAALRFVPDFLAESKAVMEAQECRGYAARGNIVTRLTAYVALVEPLVLRAVSRSESMALSLALRGFGGSNRRYGANVALGIRDYGLLAGMAVVTVALMGMRSGMSM